MTFPSYSAHLHSNSKALMARFPSHVKRCQEKPPGVWSATSASEPTRRSTTRSTQFEFNPIPDFSHPNKHSSHNSTTNCCCCQSFSSNAFWGMLESRMTIIAHDCRNDGSGKPYNLQMNLVGSTYQLPMIVCQPTNDGMSNTLYHLSISNQPTSWPTTAHH